MPHAPRPARRAAVLVLVLTALLPAAALAASRPYAVTEEARTLPPKGIRLEAGVTREDWDTGNKFYALTAELTGNLYPNLDVEASVPWAIAGGAARLNDGFGDIRTRAKLNFARERDAFPVSLSGMVELKFPTGIDLVSTGETDVRLVGLAGKDLGNAKLDGNVFYTFVGEGTGQSFRNVAGFSAGAQVQTPVDGLTGLGEFAWEQSRTRGDSAPFSFLGGGRYAVSPRLALDFGLLIGWGAGPVPVPGTHQRGLAGTFGLTWAIAP